MGRDNIVQTRLSDAEYTPIETIVEEEECSEAEAVRKCIRAMRAYSDDELIELIRSDEFEAITRLMRD